MAKYSNKDGVWRTIKGRHIFIKEGQSINDALEESEKYKKERMKKQSLQNANEEGRRQRDAINTALAEINNSEVKRKQFAEKYDTIIHDDGYVETIPKRTNHDYFGKEQYEKHGDTLYNNYYGKNISKKIEDADKPNGLRTVAKQIGAEDEYEVVKALEGMSRNGKAREIDDSTYKITDTIKDNPVRNGLVNEKEYIKKNNMEPKERYAVVVTENTGPSRYTSKTYDVVDNEDRATDIVGELRARGIGATYSKLDNNKDSLKEYPQLTRNGTLYNITEHKDEGYYKGISASGRSFVGKSKEKYKIENPNDASDWGWIEREEYDKLTSKGKLTDEADIARRIRQGKMNKDDYFMNDTYYLGKEKEGYYVQFQDVQSNKYDDVTKYPNSSPRVSSHTLARVWKDGNIIYNNDGAKEGREKYTSRAKVAKFLEGEKSYSTLIQSYMNAGFTKAQAEALAKYQLRRRK